MRKIPSMKNTTATVLTLAALILGGAVSGCDDADSTTDAATTPAAAQSGKDDAQGNGSAPASANDKPNKNAPDNAISDRPGGPNDKGKQSKAGKDAADREIEGSGQS
jgi:hypothetical protein